MTDPEQIARVTVLAPNIADLHETVEPTCLVAPDGGHTCCDQPAAYRLELRPMHGHDYGPVTFACPAHEPLLPRPLIAHTRSVTP